MSIGLRGIALGWFQSYLSGRSYRVIYAGSTSSVIYIVCSVPQGSVIYVADLVDIVGRHGVTLHSFADDTQLYCDNYRVSGALEKLEHETILQDRASDR